jgi:proteic killer suppression protein
VGIKPDHAQKRKRLLARLDIAKTANDVNVTGWRLHPLSGDLAGYYSLVVNGNWRITFKFEGEDVVLLDYLDYH